MTTQPITPSERASLRALAAAAHARELGRELSRLDLAFGAWRAGRVTPHELAERIGKFHEGVARELAGIYARLDPTATVARAIALGFLATAEVPPALLAKLGPAVDLYRVVPRADAETDADADADASAAG